MANAIELTRVFNHYNRDMAAITYTLRPLHFLRHYSLVFVDNPMFSRRARKPTHGVNILGVY